MGKNQIEAFRKELANLCQQEKCRCILQYTRKALGYI